MSQGQGPDDAEPPFPPAEPQPVEAPAVPLPRDEPARLNPGDPARLGAQDSARRDPLDAIGPSIPIVPGREPAPEPPPPAPDPPPRGRAYVRDYLETLLVAVLVVLFTATFVAQNSVIPSASMEDTLLIGDYLLVDRIVFAPEDVEAPAPWLAQRPVERGDVIVFKFPKDPGTDYIKRVIGLPGDVVEIRGKQLRRNGSIVLEPYKRHKTGLIFPVDSPEGGRDNYGPVKVPEGMLFVLGDNRDYSADSREWAFLPRRNVTGRAFVIFWSKQQEPGQFQMRGFEKIGHFLRSFTSFYRDTRWHRLGTVVR